MSDTFHSIIELLCVELWREIFEYFDSNDLWYSFHGLNRKIDAIINQTTLHLNFKKQGSYSYFMKNVLSTMNVANVRSLKLQEADETKHFFSIYSLNSLVQLRLLSLTSMYCFNDDSFTFWDQLSSLKYLRSLEIIFWVNFRADNCNNEKKFIIRSIFNKDYCPLLESFIISTSGRYNYRATIPSLITTTQSTNIKYMSTDSLNFNDLLKLLPALQNVKSFRTVNLLYYGYKSNEQEHNMTFTMPLLPKCIRLQLKLATAIRFEHVEYILKHTPNLKDLFLWSWSHLLNAKRWELLLSVQCPKLIKLELICTGRIDDDNFNQAIDDFDHERVTRPFWLERNITMTDDEEHPVYNAVVRFNIKKSRQPIGCN